MKDVTPGLLRASPKQRSFWRIPFAVNIGIANEMARLCYALNVDTWEVIGTAATNPFAFMPFYPGPGIGGNCISLDPHYLSGKARQHGFESCFIALAEEVNSRMPEHVVQLIADGLNDARKAMNGSRVLLLGVAYQKDIGHVRESLAPSIIDRLRAKGVDVAITIRPSVWCVSITRTRRAAANRGHPFHGLTKSCARLIASGSLRSQGDGLPARLPIELADCRIRAMRGMATCGVIAARIIRL